VVSFGSHCLLDRVAVIKPFRGNSRGSLRASSRPLGAVGNDHQNAALLRARTQPLMRPSERLAVDVLLEDAEDLDLTPQRSKVRARMSALIAATVIGRPRIDPELSMRSVTTVSRKSVSRSRL
jgi:hypothetical protein